MSLAFSRGVTEDLPNALVFFDKFHVFSHASEALDRMRRIEQTLDAHTEDKRCVLLKDRVSLTVPQRTDFSRLLSTITATRTAPAWQNREELREILTLKPPTVVTLPPTRWRSNVLNS